MKKMFVGSDRNSDFKKIQEAVDAVSENNYERVEIHIKNGIYKEKLYIDKPYISLIGEDPLKTIITYDDYALKQMPDGDKMGTFRSYSVFIGGNDFIAKNITFENSAGPGKVVGQAVAAYVDGDKVAFKNCRFVGNQDTLFTGPLPPKPVIANSFKGPRENAPRMVGRQYYEDCYIEGDVDFIFGSATAYFNRCEIFSKNRGYITAASTPEGQKYGYVFNECRLNGNCENETVYLGRPWRSYAKVLFMNCFMGAHIKPEGWHNWDNKENEKTAWFAEYNSKGKGARMNDRVSWAYILNSSDIEHFSIENVLSGEDGWDPRLLLKQDV